MSFNYKCFFKHGTVIFSLKSSFYSQLLNKNITLQCSPFLHYLGWGNDQIEKQLRSELQNGD